MEIAVNGTRLWFDVDGPSLVPFGDDMATRPTVVLVHGGPAATTIRTSSRISTGSRTSRRWSIRTFGITAVRRAMIVGDLDPVTPVSASEEIVAGLRPGLG